MRNTLIAIFGTVMVPCILHLLIPYLVLRGSSGLTFPPIGLIEIVSFIVAAAGIAMVIWVSTIFVRLGKGTAMPLVPTKEFVPIGLYRYVRNPMYLGLLVVILAEAVIFRSVWLLVYAGLLWLATHFYVVYIEEPDLIRRFGNSYEKYRMDTPRWIPRPPRHKGA